MIIIQNFLLFNFTQHHLISFTFAFIKTIIQIKIMQLQHKYGQQA